MAHTAGRSTLLLQEFGWEVFNHHPPYSPDLAPSDFHFFAHIMGGSPGDVSENPVMYEKRKKGWRMSCDVGEATEWLENEL